MKLVWLTVFLAHAIAAPTILRHFNTRKNPNHYGDTSSEHRILANFENFSNEETNRVKKSTNPVGCYTVVHPDREPYSLCSDGEAVAAAASPPGAISRMYERLFTPKNEDLITSADQITTPGLHTSVRADQMFTPPAFPNFAALTPQLPYRHGYYPLPSGFGDARSGASYGCGERFTGSYYPYRAGSNQVNDLWLARRRHQLERTIGSGQIELDFPQSATFENVIPTLPLPGGQQVRGSYPVGVFPNSIKGGCGGIPLMVSCSPSVVRGILIPTGGYDYTSLGNWRSTSGLRSYGSPWMDNFGRIGHRADAVTASGGQLGKKVSQLNFETSDKNNVTNPTDSNRTNVVNENSKVKRLYTSVTQ